MPKIKIPASSANLGSGFDSIGIALSMYNNIEFELIDSGLEIISCDKSVPTDKNNLIYKSLLMGLEATGTKVPGIRIWQNDNIPQARGLGSSSACVVGGIVAANIISGAVLSTDDMIAIAAKIEGHPDNILPTFVGGITAGVMEGDSVKFVHISPPENLKCCVMIPKFELSTKKARAALPETISMKDAIFNLSRSALMIGAMSQGRMDLISTAIEDALHQPYRKEFIPRYDEIMLAIKNSGALGACISGAGPTLLAFLDKDYMQFVQRMKLFFQRNEIDWEVQLLDICAGGVSWEI